MGPGQAAAGPQTAACPEAYPAPGGLLQVARHDLPGVPGPRPQASASPASIRARAHSFHETSYAHRNPRYGCREEPWLDVT
jgi:hypothetical protein